MSISLKSLIHLPVFSRTTPMNSSTIAPLLTNANRSVISGTAMTTAIQAQIRALAIRSPFIIQNYHRIIDNG